MPVLHASPLRLAISHIFQLLGAPEVEARIVADHLVAAELAGVSSHGILRVPQYVKAVEEGKIVTNARLTVVKDAAATAVLDGGHGFGQVMARYAVDRALAIAARTGVAAVTLANCSHTGRLGSYTEYGAAHGMITLMMVNAGGCGQWVAPFGGTEGRLGTNPISIAVPSGAAFPLLLDIATSAAPEGRIRSMVAANKPIPQGWVLTHSGRPTTDPADLYGPPRGTLLPFGGHKGFGLALLIDALAGGLSGAGCCTDSGTPLEARTDGVFIVAIQPDFFCALPAFQQQIQLLIRHVKSSAPAPGINEVLVPGEIEARTRQQRERDGIPVVDSVWQSLESVFAHYRVPLDEKR